jgi:hypothetical protein
VDITVNGREDRALEAVLVLAFLEELMRAAPVLSGPEPELDPADQRALDGLGPDLVQRILDEEDERSDEHPDRA